MLIEEQDTTSNDLGDNETGHEDDAAAEGNGEETQHDTQSAPETVTLTKAELDERLKAARKDQDKRWKSRLKVDDDEDQGDDKDDKEEEVDDRYDRLELKTEGVTDKKEQQVVLDYARFKNIPVLEALQSAAVKAELRELRDKAATPSPSRRTGGGAHTDDIDYWVAQYKRGGKSAPSLDMRRKVRKALKAGA